MPGGRRDYLIVSSKERFYSERMAGMEVPLAILSVFKERCRQLANKLGGAYVVRSEEANRDVRGFDLVVSTPLSFLNMNLDVKTVVLDEPYLIEPFGYTETIERLRERGCSFVAVSDCLARFAFLDTPVVVSDSVECYCVVSEEEKFLALFSIIKFGLFGDDVGVVVNGELEGVKTRLFLKTLGCRSWDEMVTVSGEHIDRAAVVIFGSKRMAIDATSVMYLSSKEMDEGLKRVDFDYKKVAQWKYRICDLLRALTQNVCRGKKKFDDRRFRNLKSMLA